MGVHGGVWKAMKSDIHWVGGAVRLAASGPAQILSGRWWAGAHDEQS